MTYPDDFYFNGCASHSRREDSQGINGRNLASPEDGQFQNQRKNKRREYLKRRWNKRMEQKEHGLGKLVEEIHQFYCDPYRDVDPIAELRRVMDEPLYHSPYAEFFNRESHDRLMNAFGQRFGALEFT